MNTTFVKCCIVLLYITSGHGLLTYAQCVAEEDVYSFSYNGQRYEVIMNQKSWSDAASCAVERGGYLAEISTQAEQDTIYQSIIYGAEVPVDYTIVATGGGIAYIWIGASDQHTEGTWLWDGDGDNNGTHFWNGQGSNGLGDGAPVDQLYNNWGGSSSGDPKEPDDYGAGQDGAAIGLAKWPAGADFALGIASEWNDISSDIELYFVAEYDCMETSHTIDESACDIYISPSGKILTTSGTYVDTIENAAGCDSVITINLDLHTVDNSVTQDGNTLTANSAGATYQWLDCINSHAIIEGETGQSFTPSSNGSYAVEISSNGCRDTSECYVLDPVEVSERSAEMLISVRQGTGNDEIHVDLGDLYGEITCHVSDIQGRIVHHESFTQLQEFLLVLNEPPGIYFITVRSGDKQGVIKFSKN